MHKFQNDYSSLCCREVMNALVEHMNEQIAPYGEDEYSLRAANKIREIFDLPNSDVHFLVGGTQTNMAVISYALRPYESVIACDSGHINVHETGAVEGSGHKICLCKGVDGKVTASAVRELIALHNGCHMVLPKMVYISDSTEIGTIYSLKELEELYAVCKEYGLYLFIDGARLGSALTSSMNDIPIKVLGKLCDVFYLGGTKNGLLAGEALVINNDNLKENFRYHIKNRGAMLAKGYLLGLQFDTILKDNLYFKLAKHTNDLALELRNDLKAIGLEIGNAPTNQIFVTLPKKMALDCISEFGSELWTDLGEKLEIRFVVSFNTTREDCLNLVNYLRNYK